MAVAVEALSGPTSSSRPALATRATARRRKDLMVSRYLRTGVRVHEVERPSMLAVTRPGPPARSLLLSHGF
jgi:hypothetical protein